MKALPATTAFPADPSGLERPVLERHYLALRGSYKSLMMSRGQYRSRADKAHADVEQLRYRLITLAAREASVRGEVYAMLDLISTITGDLEDAGDDLVQEFGRYKLGRRSFQGGSFLGGLVQAVIRFINRWTTTKQRFDELSLRQQAITSRLEGTDVADPERKDGTDR
ncbi:hypothetical protein KBZ18_14690 [Synechococcus sp. Cruz-9H2]|nr:MULTISPECIES: hypothetical protein [unclassified Synechococcus]MCP9820730.1 hypothetical protein [Synechococcus sp. Cruz-9H2]MCP9864420.1 hypothetical protein [Synechococcus sp. Cruz-7E5]MCP9871640.1 hypothetical protein [Synechococcus sp. Cruz-7B9]MCP9845014.1 hypothetical protein [Synechococcus sp. Edmonson 11F2]MCP9857135.1 hypothetical protein [Synechococcus sp. Cruz-9C9]